MRPIRPDYNPFYHTRLEDEKELDISISHAGLNIIVPWMTCYSIHRLMELPQTMFYNILHLQDLINDWKAVDDLKDVGMQEQIAVLKIVK